MRYGLGKLLEELSARIPSAVAAIVVVGLVIFGLVQVVRMVVSFRQYARTREADALAERGRCPNCGYDCNESDRLCSECGEKNPVYYRREIREFLERERQQAGQAETAAGDDDSDRRDA